MGHGEAPDRLDFDRVFCVADLNAPAEVEK